MPTEVLPPPPVRRRTSGLVQSVDKAVRLLRAFDGESPDLGVSELSRSFGWQKSTISRLLATLQTGGLLEQNPRSGRYRVSPLFIGMGARALARLDVRSYAQPAMQALAAATGETVNLVVISEGECFNLSVIHSSKNVTSVGWVGRRTPLHCTAAGKALLWLHSRAQVGEILGESFPALTSRTLTTLDQLWPDLEKMRARGYAVNLDELEEGLASLSAPVFDAYNQVSAALTVTGPTFRLQPHSAEWGLAVRERASALSKRLGSAKPAVAAKGNISVPPR